MEKNLHKLASNSPGKPGMHLPQLVPTRTKKNHTTKRPPELDVNAKTNLVH